MTDDLTYARVAAAVRALSPQVADTLSQALPIPTAPEQLRRSRLNGLATMLTGQYASQQSEQRLLAFDQELARLVRTASEDSNEQRFYKKLSQLLAPNQGWNRQLSDTLALPAQDIATQLELRLQLAHLTVSIAQILSDAAKLRARLPSMKGDQ